jgi:microcystin-dependent protein
MANAFIGEIRMVGFNFAPRGWAFCDGQLLPISQNPALFSLLGTTFGGDGRTSFALPDFRGRVPIHRGQGRGLTNRELGAIGGLETVTVPIQSANPQFNENDEQAAAGDAAYAETIDVARPAPQYKFDNLQPFLTANFIIAVQGDFPLRD